MTKFTLLFSSLFQILGTPREPAYDSSKMGLPKFGSLILWLYICSQMLIETKLYEITQRTIPMMLQYLLDIG